MSKFQPIPLDFQLFAATLIVLAEPLSPGPNEAIGFVVL
jgi:hypothetical protein